MRIRPASLALAIGLGSGMAHVAAAQQADNSRALHWRQIGPTRGGRARALSGVPSQPNVFYVGYDNGGVWRSTDYGSTWVPLFDDQPTGSIGAIAVAPSDPNIIYVGSGAGIIRPDLATGDGVYKSTDGGKTWTHLGLRDSQMIAMIDVDPRDPNRLFVAALGHPYGPNAERGIFRSTDGGQSFQKVLFKDEYTSGNDVRIDPTSPNTVYATLWQQQQSFIEGQGFGGAGNGIYKSTDGGATWKQLTEGLPSVIQANIALAPSNPRTLYATVAGTMPSCRSGPPGEHDDRRGGLLQVDGRRGALDDRRELRARGRRRQGGSSPARPHRRRRPADGHRRSEERERRVHGVHGHVAHRGRWNQLVSRARRPGRRRLPEDLDQP
jgi:photosystem II stability/assembly factor-like uncharacterized protein